MAIRFLSHFMRRILSHSHFLNKILPSWNKHRPAATESPGWLKTLRLFAIQMLMKNNLKVWVNKYLNWNGLSYKGGEASITMKSMAKFLVPAGSENTRWCKLFTSYKLGHICHSVESCPRLLLSLSQGLSPNMRKNLSNETKLVQGFNQVIRNFYFSLKKYNLISYFFFNS